MTTGENEKVQSLDTAALRAYRPKRLQRPELKRAAVLIPLLREQCRERIVFTARHEGLRFQPGHISLPGGKAEPDECDLAACALREAEEEIALHPDQVDVLGQLDDVVVASRYVVTPFAGLVAPGAPIQPAEEEVAQLILIDVGDLLPPAALEAITFQHEGITRRSYQFTAGAVRFWGATARIVKRFLEIGYGAEYGNLGVE